MNSVVGFTIFSHLSDGRVKALQAAQNRVLEHFEHLERRSLRLGGTQLELWGHKGMEERIHTLPDGSLVVVIGSPHGRVVLKDLQEDLFSSAFELPWDGRVILLRISADGRHWSMWNDWLGSIPVFHAAVGSGRIASTLEPVAVAAAGYTSNDFFMPGMIFLLIHGNFIGDWTLYKSMKVAPPDSHCKWDENGFHSNCLSTVTSTDARWENGWEELVDEMHELSYRAIADVFGMHPNWILPLSSGLDSRLLAGVGARLGVDIHAYCWGKKESVEVVCSHSIARALGIPWKWFDVGADYLVDYAPLWADMFGSAMHFHGMYQMPFYDELKSAPPGPIISGFLGDTLAGYDVQFQSQYHSSWAHPYQVYPDGYIHWSVAELQGLLKFPVEDALEQMRSELSRQKNSVPGPGFQSLRFLTLWGRQRHFTSFQSVLCDYWRGVATPYLNKAYARFCLSLPRAVLEERRLQGDVFRRYYGILATIPGSYAEVPFKLTGRYLLKQRISKFLPDALLRGPFQEFNVMEGSTDIDCVRKHRRRSFWPVFDGGFCLGDWINMDEIEKVYNTAMTGDQRSVRKLQSVQTLAYRLMNETGAMP